MNVFKKIATEDATFNESVLFETPFIQIFFVINDFKFFDIPFDSFPKTIIPFLSKFESDNEDPSRNDP